VITAATQSSFTIPFLFWSCNSNRFNSEINGKLLAVLLQLRLQLTNSVRTLEYFYICRNTPDYVCVISVACFLESCVDVGKWDTSFVRFGRLFLNLHDQEILDILFKPFHSFRNPKQTLGFQLLTRCRLEISRLEYGPGTRVLFVATYSGEPTPNKFMSIVIVSVSQ
jgi:hypothetical protein